MIVAWYVPRIQARRDYLVANRLLARNPRSACAR